MQVIGVPDTGEEVVRSGAEATFDCAPAGNIGPVADALMDALGMDFTVICPALPASGRTVRDGRLFVGDAPLDTAWPAAIPDNSS
ncbi:four-carbon acid sugar kinase family protein [Streptomyces asiaticus]